MVYVLFRILIWATSSSGLDPYDLYHVFCFCPNLSEDYAAKYQMLMFKRVPYSKHYIDLKHKVEI